MLSKKEKVRFETDFVCSGGRIRTFDLRVMSPTSYQLLHPAIGNNITAQCLGNKDNGTSNSYRWE
jgi:hypothetical protein